MKIKNWNTFQHFKDRRPPWIKLHREILDQRDINMISDRSFRVLVGLWLLASEDEHMEGRLPEIDDICFRLRMGKPCIIKALKELEPFLYQNDIKVISKQYQDDVPETEERQRTETYKKEKDALPHFIPKDAWDLYCQHRGKKFTSKAKALALKKLEAWHKEGQNIEEILNNSVMNNWKGIFPQQTKGSTNGRYTADDALRDVFAELDREEKANNAPHTPVLLSIE